MVGLLGLEVHKQVRLDFWIHGIHLIGIGKRRFSSNRRVLISFFYQLFSYYEYTTHFV